MSAQSSSLLADLTAPLPSSQSARSPPPLSQFDNDMTRDLSPDLPCDDLDEPLASGPLALVDPGSEQPAVPPDAALRALRGRYILEAEIGRGGVGTIYRAFDLNRAGLPREHRHVALKMLREEAAQRPDAVHALRREYHQAQLLSHPGIVNVFDFDHDGGTYFVTMELLDGEALGALTRRLLPNKLPGETAIRILRELGDAISYAHERGVLHLDLKPDNVMIDAAGHVRVLDFGLAQTHTPEPWSSDPQPAPPAATPAYASCERLVQERPDVRDDIYSFSCIAYELLGGQHPFDRHSAIEARKEGVEARRIRELSRRQWHALQSGLAWAREDRPSSMQELLQRLALDSSVPTRLPPGRVWQAGAAMAVLVFGTVALTSWESLQRRNDQPGRTLPAEVNVAKSAANLESTTAAISTAKPMSDLIPESAVGEPPPRRAVVPVEADHPEAELTRNTSHPQDVTVSARNTSKPRNAAAVSGVSRTTPTVTAQHSDVLGFSHHSFSVREGTPVAQLNVHRDGNAAGEASFRWYTRDDSARAGADYAFGTGEIVMAPGQTTATFDVQIVDDSITENPELLQVVIGNSRGASVGAADHVPVIIVDDD
jgi:serine/threonine protein kinase